ncbi:hypothetical protein BJX62DRAFT_203055 [Aspergillus germanicus]
MRTMRVSPYESIVQTNTPCRFTVPSNRTQPHTSKKPDELLFRAPRALCSMIATDAETIPVRGYLGEHQRGQFSQSIARTSYDPNTHVPRKPLSYILIHHEEGPVATAYIVAAQYPYPAWLASVVGKASQCRPAGRHRVDSVHLSLDAGPFRNLHESWKLSRTTFWDLVIKGTLLPASWQGVLSCPNSKRALAVQGGGCRAGGYATNLI